MHIAGDTLTGLQYCKWVITTSKLNYNFKTEFMTEFLGNILISIYNIYIDKSKTYLIFPTNLDVSVN